MLKWLYAISKRGVGTLANRRDDSPAQRKLPVSGILLESYRRLFGNFPVFLRLIWFPFSAVFTVRVLTNTSFGPFGPYELGPFEELFVGVVLLLCLTPSITAWHRLTLLESNPENRHIRCSFDAAEYRYSRLLLIFAVIFFLVFAFVVAPITGGVLLALGPPISVGNTTVPDSLFQSLYSFILFWVLQPAAFLPLAGFLLVLPAAAIGRVLNFVDTLTYAKGNIGRLGSALVAAFAPMVVLNVWFEELAKGWMDGNEIYAVVTGVVFQTSIAFLFGAILVGVLSLAYIALVEEWEYRKSD